MTFWDTFSTATEMRTGQWEPCDTPTKKNMKTFFIIAVLLGSCTLRSNGRELDPEQYIGDPNAPIDEVPPELADDVEWEKTHENTNLALGMACLCGGQN